MSDRGNKNKRSNRKDKNEGWVLQSSVTPKNTRRPQETPDSPNSPNSPSGQTQSPSSSSTNSGRNSQRNGQSKSDSQFSPRGKKAGNEVREKRTRDIFTEKVQIPAELAGHVIGKQYKNIVEIQQKHNVKITVEKETSIATINSSVKSAALDAAKDILEKVEQIKAELAERKAGTNKPSTIISATVKMEPEVVGLVVGAKHTHTNEIAQRHNVRIKIEPDNTALITGLDEESVQKAYAELLDRVTYIEDRRKRILMYQKLWEEKKEENIAMPDSPSENQASSKEGAGFCLYRIADEGIEMLVVKRRWTRLGFKQFLYDIQRNTSPESLLATITKMTPEEKDILLAANTLESLFSSRDVRQSWQKSLQDMNMEIASQNWEKYVQDFHQAAQNKDECGHLAWTLPSGLQHNETENIEDLAFRKLKEELSVDKDEVTLSSFKKKAKSKLFFYGSFTSESEIATRPCYQTLSCTADNGETNEIQWMPAAEFATQCEAYYEKVVTRYLQDQIYPPLSPLSPRAENTQFI